MSAAHAPRQTSYRRGLAAENLAALWLRLKGYRIEQRRYKTPVGEIDLIAQRRGVLVFVEVKARVTPADALHSLSPRMQQRIVRAARYYVAQNPSTASMPMRFDLVTVSPPFSIHHLDNAWRPPT